MKFIKYLLKTYSEEYRVLEGLIRTHDIGSSIARVHYAFPNLTAGHDKQNKNPNTFWVIWSVDNPISDYDKFLQLITNLGWLISYMYIDGQGNKYEELVIKQLIQNKQYKKIRLDLEAKFDIRVHDERIPKILFHVTHKNTVQRILKQGITPRAEQKMAAHPERVYLTDTLEHAKTFLYWNAKQTKTSVEDWITLKVQYLPPYVKLFKDPNFEFGYYALNTIPPQSLQIVNV